MLLKNIGANMNCYNCNKSEEALRFTINEVIFINTKINTLYLSSKFI